MSSNKKVFKFITILSPSVKFFSIHMKRGSAFLYHTASFILVIAIVFCQSNLFWNCTNGFVNIFSVHNDFNATNNFIRFLNFTYSFMEVNVDVSYDDNRNLSKLMNKLNLEVMVVIITLS